MLKMLLKCPENCASYNFLKQKGWFDFIDDIVVPEWRVEGVRLDTENNYPLTIKTPYIRCENTPNLLGQIKSIKENLRPE